MDGLGLIDPEAREVVWFMRGACTSSTTRTCCPTATSFYSKALGSQRALDNDNILITESLRGRIFEITRSGRVVWEYLNPAEVNGFHAYILDAQRLPAGSLPSLDDD